MTVGTTELAVAISALATTFSLGASLFAHRFRSIKIAGFEMHLGGVPTPSEVARERVVARLTETKNIMQEQESSAKLSRISANSLTVGQFVVGGLLASAFSQTVLPAKLVGFLGLLVLLASLIKQHFHPDISAQRATVRAAQLKGLIRRSEDQLAVLDAKIASGQDHTDAMISLMMKITDRLTEIETPEAIESKPELAEKSA